jgi:hypothetical protein
MFGLLSMFCTKEPAKLRAILSIDWFCVETESQLCIAHLSNVQPCNRANGITNNSRTLWLKSDAHSLHGLSFFCKFTNKNASFLRHFISGLKASKSQKFEHLNSAEKPEMMNNF